MMLPFQSVTVLGAETMGHGIGLDVQMEAAAYLYGALGSEAFRPPKLLEGMVAEGKLGKKSGEGFYSWSEDGPSDEP